MVFVRGRRALTPVLSRYTGRGGKARRLWVVACIALISTPACRRNDMRDQPKYTPYRESEFFADGASARPIVAGTVARSGFSSTQPAGQIRSGIPAANSFPMPVTKQILLRGRERFTIYCSPCHGDLGDGDGMIVQRGFTRPPSFHEARLVNAPLSHFYDVISNGYGAMYSYSDRVNVDDRWAIIAYVRALQLSQRAPVETLTNQDRTNLQANAQNPESGPR